MKLRLLLVGVSLLLSVAIGLAVAHSRGDAAGSGPAAKDKKIVIGLSLDTLKEARWQGDRDAFIARCQELGAEVKVESANSDDTVQVQNVTGLLSLGVDVLVVAPHNAAAMARAVTLSHAQGVPVIAYDRLITGCDLDLYLSFDNVRVGRVQGQYVVDQAAKSGKKPFNLVRIYGSKTDNNAVLFKQGQDEALKPAIDDGTIKVVQEDWADDWKPENAKRIMNAAVTNAGQNIDAVLASNDGEAGGAIQALNEEGLGGKVLVTGQDADLVACQRIVGGTQAMTIYKPVKHLAAKCAELAVAMAAHKPVVANTTVNNEKVDVPTYMLDTELVTKATMDNTVIKDGFHTHDEVYGK